MLESIFIILLIVGIILLILMVEWESLAIGGLCFAIWMTLALSIHQIEIPYQYTNNQGIVVESTQSIENMFPLSTLFIGIAVIVMLYMIINLMLPTLYEKIQNKKML